VTRPSSPISTETSSEELVAQFQAGDPTALERLWERYLPRLRRWAHRRLPAASRGETSTEDLVQDAFVRSLASLRTLKPRSSGGLYAYFRTIILNQVRDFARRAQRRPPAQELDPDAHMDRGASPLQLALSGEVLERYERALETLSENDRQLMIAFIELRCTDRELAELFEKPTANAARVARARALVRLGQAMAEVAPDVRSAPLDRPST
jgi:RNA polymerase sigma-70 factor (ECF subfamily)